MTSEWQRRSSVSFFVSRSFLFCFFNRRVFIFTGGGGGGGCVTTKERAKDLRFSFVCFFLFPGRMRDDDNVAHQETAQSAWAIEFYWVLLGFIGFYRVLLSFTGFYRVLLGFTGFYWVLLGFTGFYWFLPGLPGFTGFYWVLLLVKACFTWFQ